jgi:hypothetical protein
VLGSPASQGDSSDPALALSTNIDEAFVDSLLEIYRRAKAIAADKRLAGGNSTFVAANFSSAATSSG